MNFSNLRESDFAQKEEGANDGSKISPKSSFTTSSWSRLKDPRIVRVSRAFGGKDRHSKVCTVKGLRDRRVRLSVPTAIQLYDLQERLGLNQPSKVIDWLLNVAKHEIDELPPLQLPHLQTMLSATSHYGAITPSQFEKIERIKTNSHSPIWDYRNLDKSKEIARETSEIQEEGIVSNGSFFKWDPSNLSLSRFKSYDHHQEDEVYNFSTAIPLGSQLPMYFHPHDHNSEHQFDPKLLNFQMLSSSSSSNFTQPLYTINQGMRPFDLSMNFDGNEPSKEN